MRPEYDVDRTREVDFSKLATLTSEEVLETLDSDLTLWLIGDFAWSDVQYWLTDESEALIAVDAASRNTEEFDSLAADVPFEADEPWPTVDVGAVALVGALNAAGCPTVWSTRGKEGSPPGVLFYADPQRARLVLAVAEHCNLGLTVTAEGLLDLRAGSVDELMAAAADLLEWSNEFDSLAPPPTAALLGTNGYWAEDLDSIRELLDIE